MSQHYEKKSYDMHVYFHNLCLQNKIPVLASWIKIQKVTHTHAINVNVRVKRNDGQYGARTHDIRVISTTL